MIAHPNARNRRRRPLSYHNSRLGGIARIPRCAAIVLRLTFDSLAWIDYSRTPDLTNASPATRTPRRASSTQSRAAQSPAKAPSTPVHAQNRTRGAH